MKRRCEDVKMTCVGVKIRGCEDVKMTCKRSKVFISAVFRGAQTECPPFSQETTSSVAQSPHPSPEAVA